MKINKFNNLLELFDYQYRIKKSDESFLHSLTNLNDKFSWEQVYNMVQKLSFNLSSFISKKDRCLLISENRPEWLIADLAIMNAGGISVPIFTTYSDNDYKYIIEDCKPSVIIVSNQVQFNKIKKYINNEIKLVISFEEINHQSLIIKDIFNDEKFEKIEIKI